MTILFISTNDHVPWGGSEVLWSRTAQLLVRNGHEVHASVRKWSPRHAALEALMEQGVLLHERERQDLRLDRWTKAWSVWRQGYVQEISDNSLEVFATLRPDRALITVGNHLDEQLPRFADELHRRGIPFEVLVQLVHPFAAVSDERADRLIAAYSAARSVLFVSEQNQRIAQLHLGHAFSNAHVISNPIDMDAWAEPMAFPPVDRGYRIAMVGALVPFHKGQDIALEVMSQAKWKERPLSLNIYGTGPGQRILERNIERLGLANVTLKGFVADKNMIWGDHHAALFASRMEGRSLALLEAMASARMVISTDVGGASEHIGTGRTGLLLAHADAASLDEALEQAWSLRDQWEEMGQRAFEKYQIASHTDPVERLVQFISAGA
jgi:glycosyltransferase involved in cell wall biosynthesis